MLVRVKCIRRNIKVIYKGMGYDETRKDRITANIYWINLTDIVWPVWNKLGLIIKIKLINIEWINVE